MDARDKYFRIKKFPDTLLFVIFPGMFWRNLTKIGDIYIPYKFAQSGCIPLKIKCKILEEGTENGRMENGYIRGTTKST